MGQIAKQFLIYGRVQGVWFRAWTKEKADKIGIKGWVRNLPDKSVEVLAIGNEKEMDKFSTLLWKGPPLAKVRDIKITEAQDDGSIEFIKKQYL